MLTLLGIVLLVATFVIHSDYEQNPEGFNFAYVTGIVMLAVFMASFVMFNSDRWKESKKS